MQTFLACVFVFDKGQICPPGFPRNACQPRTLLAYKLLKNESMAWAAKHGIPWPVVPYD
jgi:hypothetical protein